MAENSKIEWTDHTFNIMWGCDEVFGSDPSLSACLHCYAREQAKRYGFDIWGQNKPRRFFADPHWQEPLKWNKTPARVFCSSMADVFEDYSGPSRELIERQQAAIRAKSPIFKNVILGGREEMNQARNRLWKLIEETPNLLWQLLTKRPENMVRMTPEHWRHGWPVNVIAMTTVENQAAAEERIPHLLKVPAKFRGLSCEPMQEEVSLKIAGDPCSCNLGIENLGDRSCRRNDLDPSKSCLWSRSQLRWVICGGESGPKKRPMNLDWARSLRDQCRAAGVAFFMKQVDKVQPIPEDLMIREFPQ